MPRGEALHEQRDRRPVGDAFRDVEGETARCQRLLGVAADTDEGRYPSTIGRPAGDLAPRYDGKLRARQVGVVRLVRVGVVDAGGGDIDQLEPVGGCRIGKLDELEDLGTAELFDLDRVHSWTLAPWHT